MGTMTTRVTTAKTGKGTAEKKVHGENWQEGDCRGLQLRAFEGPLLSAKRNRLTERQGPMGTP